MDYNCDICDKTIKVKSKRKHYQPLTKKKLEKGIQTKHTIKNLDFFDVDVIINGYLTNYKKKFCSYLIK